MTVYDLIQAYEFNEVMPAVVEMFPGTGKFRPQLQQAWDMMLGMRPVRSNKVITYKIMQGSRPDESYIGAEDKDFDAPWNVLLGKELKREKGVDLNNLEMLTNAFINICLTGRHPKEFDAAYKIISTPDR